MKITDESGLLAALKKNDPSTAGDNEDFVKVIKNSSDIDQVFKTVYPGKSKSDFGDLIDIIKKYTESIDVESLIDQKLGMKTKMEGFTYPQDAREITKLCDFLLKIIPNNHGNSDNMITDAVNKIKSISSNGLRD